MANVDDLTIEDMADNRQGVDRDDKLFQLIVSDFSYVFKKVKNASQYRLQDMFSDEKYVKLLADSYVNTHPEVISDTILGPSNNMFFAYSQNSYVSDTVRKFKKDESYLREHLNKIYNDNSYYGKQLLVIPKQGKVLKSLHLLCLAKVVAVVWAIWISIQLKIMFSN